MKFLKDLRHRLHFFDEQRTRWNTQPISSQIKCTVQKSRISTLSKTCRNGIRNIYSQKSLCIIFTPIKKRQKSNQTKRKSKHSVRGGYQILKPYLHNDRTVWSNSFRYMIHTDILLWYTVKYTALATEFIARTWKNFINIIRLTKFLSPSFLVKTSYDYRLVLK